MFSGIDVDPAVLDANLAVRVSCLRNTWLAVFVVASLGR